MKSDYLKNVFRGLHIVLALIGAGLCVLLVMSKGGHPPGIVLVPIVLVIWLAGHALLWLSRRLSIRGKYLADSRSSAGGKWPVVLILLALISGIVFIFGLFVIVWQVFIENDQLRELVLPLVFWTPISLCFFGFLLRKSWSRILAGGGFIVVAAVLAKQMVESLMRSHQHSGTEWVIAIIVSIVLVLFGLYILRSSRIKAFYS